jgi:O-antigen/teichoic acid export membrane protein
MWWNRRMVLSKKPTLAQRSVTSVGWNVVANSAKIVVGFVRSVLLARMLPVEVFGIYALASSVVALTGALPSFGMGGAFIHRAPETADEDQAAAIHFTLKLIFSSVWAVVLMAAALFFTGGQDRLALLVLAFTGYGGQLAQTPQLILTRRVMHRRLALMQFLRTVFAALVAVGLAWRGATLWALLSTDVVALVLTVSALFIWRPVWRPRLAWSAPTVRYYLRFGSRGFVAVLLLRALDRVDDIWAGLFLGKTPLSFYSRAYRFATYPRSILSEPINAVAGGTYAELKEDRPRLSRAFFRVNAFLVRSGFLLAGWLALIAPEFVRLLLGAKWLPMVDAFRLMLVFTLLDPIKVTVGKLFLAVGKPEQLVRARSVQLVVLLAGLFLLGLPYGIEGVALAVNIMLVVGMAILLRGAKAHVDLSLRGLFGVPGVALLAGLALGRGVSLLAGADSSDWRAAAVKSFVFLFVYAVVLLALEYRRTLDMVLLVAKRFSNQPDLETEV